MVKNIASKLIKQIFNRQKLNKNFIVDLGWFYSIDFNQNEDVWYFYKDDLLMKVINDNLLNRSLVEIKGYNFYVKEYLTKRQLKLITRFLFQI